MAPAIPPPACPECAGALRGDQRYCLSCGARVAAPRLDPVLQARGAEPAAPVAAAPGVSLPGPRLAALLTLSVLAAGTLVGALSGTAPTAEGAPAARRVVLLAAPPAPVVATAPAPAVPAPTPEAPAPTPAPNASVPAAPEPTPAAEAPANSAPPPAVDPAPTPEDPAPTPDDDTPLVTPPAEAPAGPAITHVWVLSLTGHGNPDAFGPAAPDPFFREELARQGVLLNNVHAVSPGSLADGLALLAGASPTPATAADCPDLARGCIVNRTNLLEQLDGTGRTWKAYVEPAPGAPAAACTPAPGPLAARDPVVFLHSVVKDPACASHLAGLDALDADLADPELTPAFSLLVPNACHDGSPSPCVPEAPAGLPAASEPTRSVLDRIRASKAYADGGLVVVLFDHGAAGDLSARRGAPAGQGGGAIGAVLLSPFVTPGHQVAAAYDQFSVLRTVEQLFSLPLLAGAAEPGVKAFGPRVFDATPPAAG